MNKRQKKKFLKKYRIKVFTKVYRDQMVLGTGLVKQLNYFPYVVYVSPLDTNLTYD